MSCIIHVRQGLGILLGSKTRTNVMPSPFCFLGIDKNYYTFHPLLPDSVILYSSSLFSCISLSRKPCDTRRPYKIVGLHRVEVSLQKVWHVIFTFMNHCLLYKWHGFFKTDIPHMFNARGTHVFSASKLAGSLHFCTSLKFHLHIIWQLICFLVHIPI